MFFSSAKKRIYLDYASATFVRKEVMSAMRPYFDEFYGNAGSIHQEGAAAKRAIHKAREKVASALRVRTDGIVFTASGTESNNLAILGTLAALHKKGVAYTDMEIISTKIEHASVIEVLSHAQSLGVTVTYAEVNAFGIIDIESFSKCLSAKTVLVTCAYVNSEIGVIQPIAKLARIVRAYEKDASMRIYMHTDAAQAPLWLPCALDALMVDMLSLDAGKCYGPKGIGILAFRHGVTISATLFGGSQEGGLRPGTENTPLIVGAAEAVAIAQSAYGERAQAVRQLRDAFIGMLESIEGVTLNGSREERVANNVNISVAGIDSEFAVITLDEKGISCSTKSACGGAKGDGSSVVRAITNDESRATSTIRFSLGEGTTREELSYASASLSSHVDAMRKAAQKLTPH